MPRLPEIPAHQSYAKRPIEEFAYRFSVTYQQEELKNPGTENLVEPGGSIIIKLLCEQDRYRTKKKPIATTGSANDY